MILELLVDLIELICYGGFDALDGRSSGSCPHCSHRLKYLARGENEDKVQCVMCERIWLRSKSRWRRTIRSAETNNSGAGKR